MLLLDIMEFSLFAKAAATVVVPRSIPKKYLFRIKVNPQIKNKGGMIIRIMFKPYK